MSKKRKKSQNPTNIIDLPNISDETLQRLSRLARRIKRNIDKLKRELGLVR